MDMNIWEQHQDLSSLPSQIDVGSQLQELSTLSSEQLQLDLQGLERLSQLKI